MIKIREFDPIKGDGVRLKREIFSIFKRGGYPDSFDENDLKSIRRKTRSTLGPSTESRCFLAFDGNRLIGAVFLGKIDGPQDVWEASYFIVLPEWQKSGVGRQMVAFWEKALQEKARLIQVGVAGILPKEVVPYHFGLAMGYKPWGVLRGFFRDDLDAVILVKRNPYYPIGYGISEDSGWDHGLVDVVTLKSISERVYQRRMNSAFYPTPKKNWGEGIQFSRRLV